MGFWYFLILLIGLFFVFKGIVGKKTLTKKIILVFSGLLCISFSIFMFSPAGYQFTAKLSNYWF